MNSLNIFYQFLNENLPFYSSRPTIETSLLADSKMLSAAIPLDDVSAEFMCELLDSPYYIKELALLPPSFPAAFLQKREEIWETIAWFLSKESALQHIEKVTISLELRKPDVILQFLALLPRLRRMEVISPTTFQLD